MWRAPCISASSNCLPTRPGAEVLPRPHLSPQLRPVKHKSRQHLRLQACCPHHPRLHQRHRIQGHCCCRSRPRSRHPQPRSRRNQCLHHPLQHRSLPSRRKNSAAPLPRHRLRHMYRCYWPANSSCHQGTMCCHLHCHPHHRHGHHQQRWHHSPHPEEAVFLPGFCRDPCRLPASAESCCRTRHQLQLGLHSFASASYAAAS
mmetsp:Transcript_158230/g.280439  ORF Transcript_158230/g.280439 Transcript_158230/m.280439 type:complete len:202 (-) Transcript_158230:536-1141(-)